jgi:gluconolactonase
MNTKHNALKTAALAAASLVAWAFAGIGNIASAAPASPIAPGATPQKLASGFAFTEGPAADAAGNVYFTDQPNNRIWIWTTPGKLVLFHDAPARANGLYFDNSGHLLACSDQDNALWRFDPKTKRPTVLAAAFAGQPFNGPNDLWVHPSGGIYFTDPFYDRPYWKNRPHRPLQDGEHVYYLPPAAAQKTEKNKSQISDFKSQILPLASAPLRLPEKFKKPNGIVGTPDGKRLYVADIGAGKTFVHDIAPDGSLSNQREFAPAGSDGLTLDAAGNLYLTGKGVVIVFSATGERIETIAIPEPWVSNVCFGGTDNKTLFITASRSLYSLRMRVAGAANADAIGISSDTAADTGVTNTAAPAPAAATAVPTRQAGMPVLPSPPPPPPSPPPPHPARQ